jgi:hypothetical protein
MSGFVHCAVRTGLVVLGYGEEGGTYEVEPSFTVGGCGTFEEKARRVTNRALADVVRIGFGNNLPVIHIETGGRNLIDGGNCLEGMWVPEGLWCPIWPCDVSIGGLPR